MATRSYTDVAPTADTIALAAAIYGFGGHSLVTPHHTVRQLWWTDRKIESKVTRSFVISRLKGQERDFLDRTLAFGEGLTDGTYMEWILERAKRLFLILSEIGVPDQIFGCIDDSWDDDDLPLSLENVPGLELTCEYDPIMNKKFYDTQFVFLLRELTPGAHIDYGPKEHIPLEFCETRPPAVSLQTWDRVFFPGRQEELFMRRKLALNDKDTGQSYKEGFLADIRKAQSLKHEHIASVWGSYTTVEESGFILFDFVGEHTLASFIDHRKPPRFAALNPKDRPILLWEWMHCLSDALAYLHSQGQAHTAIRPSNIIIDRRNRIAFSDLGSIKTLQRGKKVDKKEIYDYAAPGSDLSRCYHSQKPAQSTPPLSSTSAFSRLRKFSSSGSTSSRSSMSSDESYRYASFNQAPPLSPPTTPPPAARTPSFTSLTSPRVGSMISESTSSTRNFSRHLQTGACPSPFVPYAPRSPTHDRLIPPVAFHTRFPKPSPHVISDPSPESCDIFSLGCIYLDILTFMLQGKRTEFVKFRSSASTNPSPSRRERTAPAPSRANPGTPDRPDTSFHANPTKIFTWLDILDAEADKRPERIYRGIPATLDLLRKMLSPNPSLRPDALEIRDTLIDILSCQCHIAELCCVDRVWEDGISTTPLSEVGIAVSSEGSGVVHLQQPEVAITIDQRDDALWIDSGAGGESEGITPSSSTESREEDVAFPSPLHIDKLRVSSLPDEREVTLDAGRREENGGQSQETTPSASSGERSEEIFFPPSLHIEKVKASSLRNFQTGVPESNRVAGEELPSEEEEGAWGTDRPRTSSGTAKVEKQAKQARSVSTATSSKVVSGWRRAFSRSHPSSRAKTRVEF